MVWYIVVHAKGDSGAGSCVVWYSSIGNSSIGKGGIVGQGTVWCGIVV